MLCTDEALQLVVGCLDRVAQALLVQVRRDTTHSFDQALGSAQIPVHEARRRVDVAIDVGEGEVAHLVSGSTDSLDLDRVECAQHLLDRF